MKPILKRIIYIAVPCILIAHIWVHTLPIWVFPYRQSNLSFLDSVPDKNSAIVRHIEKAGAQISPTYKSAVCTEFIIAAMEPFTTLTKSDKAKLRIITDQDLKTLIANESPVIRGVQYALTDAGKGVEIRNANEVLPGDFVQFWNVYAGWPSGHCGVVADISPGKTITLYSSHPLTGGYGRQLYAWPDKTYFVRLL